MFIRSICFVLFLFMLMPYGNAAVVSPIQRCAANDWGATISGQRKYQGHFYPTASFTNPSSLLTRIFLENNAIRDGAIGFEWLPVSQWRGGLPTEKIITNGLPQRSLLSGTIYCNHAAPSVYFSWSSVTSQSCGSVQGWATVNDPRGKGGTGTLTLPDGSTMPLDYTGKGKSFRLDYINSSPPGTFLNFSGSATSSGGAIGYKTTGQIKVIPGNYSASLAVSPSPVSMGTSVQGALTVCDTGTV